MAAGPATANAPALPPGQPGSPVWLTAEIPETSRWGSSCGRQPGRRPGRRDQTDGHGVEDNSKVIELKKIFQVLFNLQRLPRCPQYLQCLPNVFHASSSICTCFATLGPKCQYLHRFGPAFHRSSTHLPVFARVLLPWGRNVNIYIVLGLPSTRLPRISQYLHVFCPLGAEMLIFI